MNDPHKMVHRSTSDILYIDANKNRTDTWLRALGLQLPSGLTQYGPISNVTYYDDVVNNENIGSDTMAKALEEAFRGNKQFSLSEAPLQDRISGDALLYAEDLMDEIGDMAEISENGYVTLYHWTSKENAET